MYCVMQAKSAFLCIGEVFFLLFCSMLAKINRIRLFFGGIEYEGNL